jgi:transposase-like protein
VLQEFHAMTAPSSIDPSEFLHEQLSQASPDLLRQMLTTFINTLMSADADSVCGAAWGERSEARTNTRNGYRHRDFDTRAGTIDVAIPKLRNGSYFPDWLLERRRRAERALTTVVATCYLLGVSTRRMEKLVESLGITRLSRSQVSVMAAELDTQVEQFRTRPLDAGPYTFVAADALVLKVREGGRVVNVHALLATGVNGDGRREILGLQVTSAEDGAGWLGFFRDLTARGLSGVRLVTSDAHAGLVAAIGATLPGVAWQRCRTHYAANLMSATPKSSWRRGCGRCCTRSTTSPTPRRCTPSSTGSSTQWPRSCRRCPSTSTPPGPTSWRSPRSRRRYGARSGRTTRASG